MSDRPRLTPAEAPTYPCERPGAPVPAQGWHWLAWGRRRAVAARLFCVSGQVSGACFTVGLSQSPQVMPRSQEHSTPAPGRVLAPGLALGRVEAPLPLFQERALESWPWAEAWGWTETHGHVVMGPWGIQETALPCPLYLGSITPHPFPPSILGAMYPFSPHPLPMQQQRPSLTSPSQTFHPHPPRIPSPASSPSPVAPGWLFTQFICSVWVFYKQRGGEGWGREGNSNGFGTSEKLRGTGSALQQSRAGHRGAVGWGGDDAGPTPHSSHTPAPPGGLILLPTAPGAALGSGSKPTEGLGVPRVGGSPSLGLGELQGPGWDGAGGVGP